MKQYFKCKISFALVVMVTLFQSQLLAQAPTNGINFQAVARDQYSNPAKDRKLFVQSSIIQTTVTGVKVLVEEHEVTTDASGVFSISVGQGKRIGGTATSLNGVDWAQGPYYLNLKIAITPVAPVVGWDYTKDLIDLGTSPFGAVPYALYAGSVTGLDKKLNIADSTKYVTPSQLNSKTFDQTPILNSIATKLNIADSLTKYVTPAQLNAKTFDSTAIYNQLGLKASAAAVNTSLALKANTTDVNSSLALKENVENKSTSLTTDGNSNTKYPTVKSVKDYVDLQVASSIATIVDASPTVKGKIQLSGDLTGTSALPTIANNAVTTAKIADGNITNAKLATGIDATKITGDITGKASNVTGTVGVLNGGTGATSAAAARTNLGLTIGTDVQAPLSFTAPLVKNANTVSINQATTSVDGYLSAADFTSFNNKIDATQKAANNGVATLGNDGKIPSNQIPAISFQSATVVNSQAAMLGLSSAITGSIAIRTDINKNFVLSALPSSTLSNWIELATPSSVTSVNGSVGPNVVLTTNDVSEGSNNKYYTDARVRSALNAASPLTFNASTGTFSMSAASASNNGYLSSSDFTTFNNKQNALIAGTDYLAPNGSAIALTNFPTLNQNTTGNAATATKLAATKNINGVPFDGSASINIDADASTLTGNTLASNITSSSLTGVGTITSGVWSGTTIAIAKGGTGATTAIGALANLGAEPTDNKSNDISGDRLSTTKFPSVKAIKDYVDLQSANAGVADNSLTSAKINGTISITKGGTGASTAAAARTNLGLVIGTDVMAANFTTTLTGDVSGSGNGSFATTVNSVGGVSASTIGGLPTAVASNTASITSNTNSITTLNTNVASNTASITANATAIATEATTARAAEQALTTSVNANTASITLNTNSIATINTNVAANTASITANATAIATEATTARAAEQALTTSVNANTASITANTNSITSLNTNVAANTASITANATAIATEATTARAAEQALTTSVNANTASITANTNSIATLNTNVAANTASITANATAIATEATTARAAEQALTTSVNANTASITSNTNSIATINSNVAANTASITANTNSIAANTTSISTLNTALSTKADIASPAFTGVPTAPTALTADNSTTIATTEYVKANLATVSAGTLTGTTLASTITSSSLTGVGTITSGVWSGTTIAITKGGTGATTAAGALTNLGAEASANKSTATDLGSTNPSDVLFPSQKAVKTYVDAQTASAGVSDGSITNAKLAGSIAASKLIGTDITTVGTITSGVWSGTAIANEKLANSALTIGSTNISLGATTSSLAGLSTVTATNFTGALTGNASTATALASGRTISTTGDITYTSGSFDGSTDVTGVATLAASGVASGTYGSSTAIPTFTVDSKGRLTAASTVGIIAGVNSLNYTSTTSYAAGGTISGTSLTLAAADASNPGLISTGAQTIAGAKTFSSDVTATNFLGNATTATKAGNITATSNTTLTSLANLAAVGTLTSGTWSATEIAIAKGGTGATTASGARTNLGLGSIATKSTIADSDVDASAAIAFSKLNVTKANITGLGVQEGLTAGSGISISAGTISATGITTSNLASNAAITNGQLANSTTTLGSTTMTLGGTVTSVTGLTSVTSTGFTGALTGNASTATKLAATKNINGVAFDGSADITVAANSNTLTGTTLASNVVSSSLTSVGTITSGVWSGTAIANANLANSTTILGSTTMTLGGTVTSVTGLTSLTATTVVGNLSGTATTATNIAGGIVGSIPYQTAAGTTALLAGNTTSTVKYLASSGNGTNSTAPTWVTPSFVPYTGATSAVDLGAYDLTVNGITLGRGNTGDETNTALGASALQSNTGGVSNTGIGYYALKTNNGNGTTGSYNIALGYSALSANTTGSFNVASGANTLASNTSGNKNSAFGNQSLRMNTTGGNNVGFGFSSLYSVTTASDNTAVGSLTGYGLSTGARNTLLGSYAGAYFSTGNTSADYNTTGLNSVFIGYDVRPLANGDDNEIVISGYNGTPGTTPGTIGWGSHSTSIGNTQTQKSRIYGALTVIPNTATGAGNSSTIAAQNAGGTNTAGGALNLTAGNAGTTGLGGNITLTPGTSTTAANKGKVIVSGSDMIVNGMTVGLGGKGDGSVSEATGSNTNVAIGTSALRVNTGTFNTAVGADALKSNTSGIGNIAIGQGAFNSLNNSGSQDRNTAIGTGVYYFMTSGQYNVGMGEGTLFNVTSGSDNVALGRHAGFLNSAGANVTSANQSVLIGSDVRPLAASSTNEIVIGYNANGNGNNTTTIGNSSTTRSIIYGSTSLSNLPATATSGNGGDFTLEAQDGFTTGNTNGGNINLTPGTSNGTGTAGRVNVNSVINVAAGTATASTNGLSSTITAQNAGTGNQNGGDINLTPGTATGTGTAGVVKINGRVQITGGSPGAGEVLMSDANGLATWSYSIGSTVVTSTTNYAITLAEAYVFYTGTAAGAFTIPAAAAGNAGKTIMIKNKTAFGISITPASGTFFIDSANASANNVSIGIEASNNWIKLVSDGTQWNVFRALF